MRITFETSQNANSFIETFCHPELLAYVLDFKVNPIYLIKNVDPRESEEEIPDDLKPNLEIKIPVIEVKRIFKLDNLPRNKEHQTNKDQTPKLIPTRMVKVKLYGRLKLEMISLLYNVKSPIKPYVN